MCKWSRFGPGLALCTAMITLLVSLFFVSSGLAEPMCQPSPVTELLQAIENPSELNTPISIEAFAARMRLYKDEPQVTSALRQKLTGGIKAELKHFFLILLSESISKEYFKEYQIFFFESLLGSDEPPRIAAFGILAKKPQLFKALALDQVFFQLLVDKQRSFISSHWMGVAVNSIYKETRSNKELLIQALKRSDIDLSVLIDGLSRQEVAAIFLSLKPGTLPAYRAKQIEEVVNGGAK